MTKIESVDHDQKYDFEKPDRTVRLAKDLVEISGLSVYDEQSLICNNDEEGIIFFIDKRTGVIQKQEIFGLKGDYEAIERVGDLIYTVQSNGVLYAYNISEKQQLIILKTAFRSKNNIEGLAYDSDHNRLLFAVKGRPYIHKYKKETSVKCIYAYDLSDQKLNEKPIIEIRDQDIESFVSAKEAFIRLSGFEQTTVLRRMNSFAPSGIAIHPITKNYYILSSRGKMIVILDPVEYEIVNIVLLDEFMHIQPEGICFDTNGDLYISNEGKSESAMLVFYRY